MTPENYRQYVGMIRLFRMRGTGGATWTGVRTTPNGPGAVTHAGLTARTIRFLENNRVAERASLPQIPVYTAPWWGLAAADVDIQEGDIYTNGVIAFEVTGVPDTSQDFQVIPAAPYAVGDIPSVATGGRRGRWIGIRAIPTYST